MQKLLFFLCCICGPFSLHAQGYNITVQLKGYTGGTVYLGHYMGKTTYVMDSARMDQQGVAVLKGKETQPGGIYLIVLPGKQRYFEILLDKQQTFSIVADTTDLAGKTEFRNSEDNAMFSAYNRYIATMAGEMEQVQRRTAAARTAQDTAAVRAASEAIGKKLQQYRSNVITTKSGTLLAAIFKAMREPVVPPMPKKEDGSLDSTYPYRYYKAHYWDDVDLADGRLVRTPVLEARLSRYFEQLVAPQPDSVIAEADMLIAKTKKDKESFKFVVWWLTKTYETSPIMGMDAVFVHLVEKYYVTGQAYWVNEEQKEKIISRAYSIAPNLIGQKAAQLVLQDTASRRTSLYDIKSKYTVVVFWDPTCGHCITEVPKLDSAFKASWKQRGVTMLGVKTEGTREEWTAFIRDKKLTGWIHAWDPGYTSNYRKFYDVYSTPVVYLLDENKKILAKRLGVEQLDGFLQREAADSARKP
ncbi:redoxin domain-containing protein [Chitinophaga sp.]|uniref:redoxin domain-containing protein n=1 Tax=Chitinophaga sp. TaxID=1869181 RepID=UPI0031D84DE0